MTTSNEKPRRYLGAAKARLRYGVSDMSIASNEKPRRHLSAAQTRHRYGDISDMSLWRWCRDPRLNFPQPLRINGRRFWDEALLDQFDAEQRAAASTEEAA